MRWQINRAQTGRFSPAYMFNYPLTLFFFTFLTYDACVLGLHAALAAPKEKVQRWVERYMLAEVHRKIAQGRPVDNYRLFTKHGTS